MNDPRRPGLPLGDTTKTLLEIVSSLPAETTGRDVDVSGVMRMICVHAQSVTGAGGGVNLEACRRVRARSVALVPLITGARKHVSSGAER